MPYPLILPALWMWIVAAAAVGLGCGAAIAAWSIRLTPLPVPQTKTDRATWILTPPATAAAFCVFVWAVIGLGSHMHDEVRPDDFGWYSRLAYHLTLIAFLVAASVTDFRDYVIPDEITLAGTLIGVVAAFASGQVQLMHLWVDWSHAVPGWQGPWIPAWIDQHRHWHGLAVSLCGLVAGAGLTWLVRAASRRILGREALGFGDVTLMAMIGSYLGWQPVLFVFLLAPLCGIIVALAVRIAGGRSYVPYGPYLGLAAFLVLSFWRPIWNFEIRFTPTSRFSLRHLFGDAPGLAMLGGLAAVAFVALLVLLRGYRAIPVAERRHEE